MSDHAASQHRKGFALHRVEGFSDAVFAFAVTLLVVSLEVPKSAHELLQTMHGFVAFGVCFVLLISVWAEHSRFFRHYPLTDGVTVSLNMLLLFVVLMYVYPMKFLFSMLADQVFWTLSPEAIHSQQEVRQLMMTYGLGFTAVNGVFLMMHWRARSKRVQLQLSEESLLELKGVMLRNCFTGGVGLLSALIAGLTQDTGLVSGMVYFLLWPLNHGSGIYIGRKVRRLQAAEGLGK
jgi:uncharacterized membrane protein